MKPREFISRVIDLFEFDIGPNWPSARPDDLTTAQFQIELASKTPGFDDVRKVVNSYLFVLEAGNELGVCVLRASMVQVKDDRNPLNQPLCDGLRATIGFIEGDCTPDFPKTGQFEECVLEAWQLPNETQDRTNELIEMLAYLILKTNHRLAIL